MSRQRCLWDCGCWGNVWLLGNVCFQPTHSALFPPRMFRRAEKEAKVYLECQAAVEGSAEVPPLTDAIKEQMRSGA